MRPSLLLPSLLIATVCLLPGELHAQPAPKPLEPSRVNAARIRWLQYRLVSGRIVASSTYPDGMNISFGPSTIGPGVRESLQLLILKDQASVRYSLASGHESLLMALDETGKFTVERRRQTPPLRMYFVQPVDKPLLLAIQQDGAPKLIAGDSLWHLYLAEPELVGHELVPFLELLRPNWQLAALGDEIERLLVAQAAAPPLIESGRWSELVAQLGAGQFSDREAAHRELSRGGQRLLPFLRQLDVNRLDAEQAARVARLKAELETNYEDNADRVASSLRGDVAAWLSIAARNDPAERRLAKSQIESNLNHEIEFDPAGAAAIRNTQLGRLRARLLPVLDEKARAQALKQLESVPPPVDKP